MNARYVYRHHLIVGLLLVMLVALASCRRVGPEIGPTLQPTLTPTPRSTPLPPVNTEIPPGAEDNPLVMLFTRPPGSRSEVSDAFDALAAEMLSAANLTITARAVTSGADALEALCDSYGDTSAVAWVDAITYAAAQAQGCGSASLFVERSIAGRATSGVTVQVIVNTNSEISSLSDLAGQTFCRLNVADLYTWIVPALMMSASGVLPVALGGIEDYDSLSDMVGDVANGTCDAAGIAAVDYADLETSRARALSQTVVVPFAVLVMPDAVPLGTRSAVRDTLLAIAADSERSTILTPLLDQSRLLPADDAALDGWNDFIRATRLNFAELGE